MSDTATIRIEGMSCGHCVAAVERALKTTTGVVSASVQVGRATIDVAASETRADVLAKAVQAIGNAGYDATIDMQPSARDETTSGCCCGSSRVPSTVTLERGGR